MTFWNCCAIPDHDLSDYIILKLDFSHKHLADVPFAVFENERTLEELYLSCNKILDLPKQLFFCQELKDLYLKNNKIEILPPAIGQLHNLEKLDISKNCLANIPESLKSCKKLQFLDIGDNAFEKLPDVITKLIHLEELYLNDSYLDFLPARFGGLTNLRILEVRHNKLITLPKSMARLTSLTRIDIGSNDFRELPEVIGCMINLKELLIDGNKISRISANVKNLKKLIHFEAGDNRLRSLPQEISNWTNVEVICLTKNDLETLPDAFGEMKSLVSLKLDDNELRELPACIGNLINLEEIMLSHNDLYCLPSSIGFLRKLKIFTCDENTLRELPDEISSCVSLKILSVRGNKLTVLPSNVGHLSNLTVMNIVNNFITHLPVSMWNLKLSALWISENQSKPLIPLQKEYFGGENYHLTCYMLPQEVYKKEHSTLNTYYPPPTTTTTTKHICFASDSIKPKDESFGLMRSPTPYPKELKTMASCARRLPVNNIEQPNPTIKEAKINNTIILNYEDIDNHKTKLLSCSPIPPPLPVRNYIWNAQSDYTDSRRTSNEYINLPPIQHFKSSQSSHINEFNNQVDYNWIEPNIELPQIQQQPPPYHIAKAYTKKSKQDLLIYDSIRKSIRDDENNSVLSSSPLPPPQTKNSSQSLNINNESIEFMDNSENNNLSVKLDEDEESITEDEDVDTLIKLLEENSDKPICSPVQSDVTKPYRQQWLFGQHRNPTVMQFSILKNPDIGFQVKQSPINGVFVSEIDEHSNAAYFLKVQDKLLDVDGQNLTKSSVKEAKLALSNSGPTMSIMISRI